MRYVYFVLFLAIIIILSSHRSMLQKWNVGFKGEEYHTYSQSYVRDPQGLPNSYLEMSSLERGVYWLTNGKEIPGYDIKMSYPSRINSENDFILEFIISYNESYSDPLLEDGGYYASAGRKIPLSLAVDVIAPAFIIPSDYQPKKFKLNEADTTLNCIICPTSSGSYSMQIDLLVIYNNVEYPLNASIIEIQVLTIWNISERLFRIIIFTLKLMGGVFGILLGHEFIVKGVLKRFRKEHKIVDNTEGNN